jgi:hypothetical protein
MYLDVHPKIILKPLLRSTASLSEHVVQHGSAFGIVEPPNLI